MSQEIEFLGGISLGALFKRKVNNRPPLDHCLNCNTKLMGKHCHVCGQLADDFQRPFLSLVAELLTDFFFLDGRIVRTIPAILFLPGKITRHYIDGKRARYVPPFRLYLVASLLFFTTIFAVGPSKGELENLSQELLANSNIEERIHQLSENIGDGTVLENEVSAPIEESGDDLPAEDDANTGFHAEANIDINDTSNSAESVQARLMVKRLAENVLTLIEQPRLFLVLFQEWLPRMSLVMLPIMVIGLALVYPFRKGVFIYDHIITALHFQTALFLWVSFAFALPGFLTEFLGFASMIGVPAYLYKMMRRVYDGGRFLTLLRAIVFSVSGFLLSVSLLLITLGTVTYTA